MIVETINSREARSNFRDILDKVLAGAADIVIERSGRPVAVMIPVEDYEALQDEIDDLRAARRAAATYEAWLRNPSIGRPYNEVRKEINLTDECREE